jgi:hypothetical protein
MLVAQLVRFAKIQSFERQRWCVSDLYCENSGQDVRGHFALSSAVTTNRRLRSSAVHSMTVVKPIRKMIQQCG